MAEQLYKQSQANAGGTPARRPQASDDDVKDGEVVDA